MFQEKDKLVNVQARVKEPAFHLLLFPGTRKEEDTNRIRRFVGEQGDLIHVEAIPLTPQTEDAYRFLGLQSGGYYLVRPDMYVSYRSNRFDSNHLKTFLKSIHL
jgi:hypothetical protein